MQLWTREKKPSKASRLRFLLDSESMYGMTENDAKPIMCYFLFRLLYPFYVCQHHINCMLSRLIKMGLCRRKLLYCYCELAFVTVLGRVFCWDGAKSRHGVQYIWIKRVFLQLIRCAVKTAVWFFPIEPIKRLTTEIGKGFSVSIMHSNWWMNCCKLKVSCADTFVHKYGVFFVKHRHQLLTKPKTVPQTVNNIFGPFNLDFY